MAFAAAVDTAGDGACPMNVGGQRLHADPSGIAFWASENTLIVSDLHLEKGSSFARKGQMFPPYDTVKTLARLGAQIDKWQPKRVIALGDSFHDADASERLPLPCRRSLAAMMKGRDWIWITGNHDPLPPADLDGEVMHEFRAGGLMFRHEPSINPRGGEVAGHLHPKARVVLSGRSVRRACFAASPSRLIMPGFGAFTGGLNVLDPAYAGLFEKRDFSVMMLGDSQVYRISARDLCS